MKLMAHSFTNGYCAVSRILLKELGVKLSDCSLTHQLEEYPDFRNLFNKQICYNNNFQIK